MIQRLLRRRAIVGHCLLAACVIACSDPNREPTPTPGQQPIVDVANVLRDVPTPVQSYFNGVDSNNAPTAASGFEPTAFVNDGRRIEGQPAIQTWIEREVLAGSYRLRSLRENTGNRAVIVLSFAGRGVTHTDARPQAAYAFTLTNGRISSLSIGPA